MENASKALLMAAGMLLVVMLLSLFALMYSTMSEYTKAYDERKQTEEIQAFNAQFEKYASGATAQDVVTVINLAKSYNDENGYTDADTEYYINIDGNIGIDETSSEPMINNFLNDNSTGTDGTDEKIKKYDVNISYSDITGKVKKITFNYNNKFFD